MDLTLEGVTVDLGRRRVLSDITATLRPGRVTAILGPNGAGKSTLLKAMAGLVPFAAGDVRLGAVTVTGMEPRRRARAIGYLPQDASVHWNVTAGEIVALGRQAHRSPFAAPSATDRAAVAAAMAATDVAAFAARPIGTLSGGERARVLLARVLAGQPVWLLADEPLASLDPAHQLDILNRLSAVAASGSGVAVVLHDLAQAARVADDVLLLKGGRVAAAGPAGAVLTPAMIAAVFDVRVATLAGDRPIHVPVERLDR